MTKITDQLYPRAFVDLSQKTPLAGSIWTVFTPGGLAYPCSAILSPEGNWFACGSERGLVAAGLEEIPRTSRLWLEAAIKSPLIRSQQQALGLLPPRRV